MFMDTPLEIKVIEKFIQKNKQDRFKQFLQSPKTRKKFTDELHHFKYLKWDLFEELQRDEYGIISRVFNESNRAGCYAISVDKSIDQKFLTLDQALELIDSDRPTILVFGEAERILYEGEPPKNRFLSKII